MTITYNFLNLPTQIVKSGSGGGTITITYDASGRKWRKQVIGEIHDYLQGIEYKDGKLEAIYGPEGRLTAMFNETGKPTHYRAEYWLKDHLGNTRLAISDEDHDGAIETFDDPSTPENESEIMQENHYYPFGMNQEGPWYGKVGPHNQYQYNGKELNEDFGLNWMDYGARWYDGSVGRWWQVDPLAEKFAVQSAYNYSHNNPLRYTDPKGGSTYDVIIKGARAQDAFKELQAGSSLALSMDQRTGKLSATGTASNAADEKLLQAINDKSTRVELTATNDKIFTDKTGDRSYLAPGGYGGSKVENTYSMYLLEDGTPQIAMSKVTASQSVNLDAAKIIAGEIGESVGQTLTHEINEAYIGANLDPGGDYSTGYNRAHNAASKLDANKADHINIVPLTGGVGVENTNTRTTKRIY